jgi:NADPH:quinone reductase-like Zn-dependent oxidoreductase
VTSLGSSGNGWPSDVRTVVRAVLLTEYGDADTLKVGEVEEPVPAPGDVLVEMASSGLNHLDVFVRQGLTGPGMREPRALPHVMGAEGAGTIVEVGPLADTDLRPGDQVMVFSGLSCGRCRHCSRGQTSRCPNYAILGEDVWGVQRERMALPARSLLRVPDGMGLDEAGAVPTTYTTAWTMLFSSGRLRVGERVLVVGASGGVSVAAIQLAAQAGAEIIATTRGIAKAQQVAALPGVRQVIDSSEPGWCETVLDSTHGQGVDLVVESVGAPTWRDSIRSLATGGRMMVCGATGGDNPEISIRELYQSHRQIIGAPFGGWTDFLEVVDMLGRSGLRPLVHATLPMDRVADGHRLLEEAAHVGKVVIKLG